MHRSRMAADSNGVAGPVLSKRSMHDKLKKSSEDLLRPGDDPKPAAHVTSAAAVGGTFNRTLPAESGAAWSAGTGTRGGCPHFARRRSDGAGNVRGNGDQRSTGSRRAGALISGRCGGCQPAGAISCHDGPLVHTRRSGQDGDRRQWRSDGALRIHQSLSGQTRCRRSRGHLRIYCSSMAIRSRTSIWSQIAARTLSSRMAKSRRTH